MEQMHEIIQFDNSVPVKCFLHKLGYSNRHWHDSMELLFILSGSTDLIVEDQVYRLHEEDLVLINSNKIHELRADNCILIALQIKPAIFEAEINNPDDLYFDCNSTTNPDKESFDVIRNLIARMVKNNTNKQNNYQLLNKSLAYNLLFILLTQYQTSSSSIKNVRSHKNMQRVAQIIDIIDHNYHSDLTLASLADDVHLSVPYLSRFFDKQLGSTFLNYLNSVRLSHAVNDLLSTDVSIEQVALDNGFSGAHSFVQIFKKNYNCLPSIYRRNHQVSTPGVTGLSNAKQFTSYVEMEQYDYMSTLSKYLTNNTSTENISGTFYHEYTLTLPDSGTALCHTWKTFLTVGSAKQLLYKKIQDILCTLQQRVGYRYIKFHGILSDEMHVYHKLRDGSVLYSYVFVDEALDFLMSIHLKPLVQLSFMPKALAADPEKTCFGYISSPPADIKSWCALVTDFTKHLIARYGIEEVRSWPFSIWNEPDTNYNMFGFSSDEEFYEFYLATYQAVKAVDSQLSIGTPSNYYLTQYEDHWIVSFYEWCTEHGCIPDFFNMHFYSTSFSAPLLDEFEVPEFTQRISLSEDENIFHTFVQQIHNVAKRLGREDIPIYLTEWNSSPSHSDLLNDTCFVSCYIIKNILENYDKLDSFGFWCLTDFLEESPLTPQTFQGELGMITYNGIPKASFYAFLFLNKLGDELMTCDDGMFLTRKGDSYQLILYNYKHFSSLYAQGEKFDMTHTNRYTTFAPEETSEMNITIANPAYTLYQVSEYSLGRHSGSSYDKWVELGAIEPEDDDDITLLKNLSTPAVSKYQLSTDDGQLKISSVLEQLEVKLFLFKPAR